MTNALSGEETVGVVASDAGRGALRATRGLAVLVRDLRMTGAVCEGFLNHLASSYAAGRG